MNILPRCFLAFPVPLDIAQRCLLARRDVPDVRWHPESNLHITLRFLGDCDNAFLDDLDAQLAQLHCPMIDAKAEGAGWYGIGKRVNSVHLKLRPDPVMDDIQKRVERACQVAGAAPEGRKFEPDITLGYCSRLLSGLIQPWLLENQFFSSPSFDLNAIALYSSHPGENGRHYRVEAEYPLVPMWS